MEVSFSKVYFTIGGLSFWLGQIACHGEGLVNETEFIHISSCSRKSLTELCLENVPHIIYHCFKWLLSPPSFDGFYVTAHVLACLGLLERHRELCVKLAERILSHKPSSIFVVVLDVLLVRVRRPSIDHMYFADLDYGSMRCFIKL